MNHVKTHVFGENYLLKMRSIFYLFVLASLLACKEDPETPEVPECIENMKVTLMEAVDSQSTQCSNFAYIDEYSFQDYYVYFIPTICYAFGGNSTTGSIYKDDCDYMTEIGFAFEAEFNGEKFSDTAEFTRRIWSYEQ